MVAIAGFETNKEKKQTRLKMILILGNIDILDNVFLHRQSTTHFSPSRVFLRTLRATEEKRKLQVKTIMLDISMNRDQTNMDRLFSEIKVDLLKAIIPI